MQNNQKIIAIFGGGGFIGKHLIRNLTKLDYRIKIATRNPYLKGYLKPLGNPGQIELFKTNIFNEEDVKNVLKNCDLAINLVGILHETRKLSVDMAKTTCDEKFTGFKKINSQIFNEDLKINNSNLRTNKLK